MRVAAIDIGTVSTRLLIADVSDEAIDEIVRHTIITHLGEGLTATGSLSAEAMRRVTSVIESYVAECDAAGVQSRMAVATSAVRDAENGEELLGMLEAAGIRPEVISGGREANLSFLGATYGLLGDDMLISDIGGGSTELVFGSVREQDGERKVDIEAARSIDVGARRATELFLHSDPPRREEMDAAYEWMADELRPFFDGIRERPRCLLALAGTATSLSAIHLGLQEYDTEAVHGSRLSGGDLVALKEELARMTLEQRRSIASLDPDRAGVIVAGAMILEMVLALAGLDTVEVTEHDILYGIALAAAGR